MISQRRLWSFFHVDDRDRDRAIWRGNLKTFPAMTVAGKFSRQNQEPATYAHRQQLMYSLLPTYSHLNRETTPEPTLADPAIAGISFAGTLSVKRVNKSRCTFGGRSKYPFSEGLDAAPGSHSDYSLPSSFIVLTLVSMKWKGRYLIHSSFFRSGNGKW